MRQWIGFIIFAIPEFLKIGLVLYFWIGTFLYGLWDINIFEWMF